MDTRFNFTKAALDALPLPEAGKRAVYHDTKVPGLQIRITANGTRSFSVLKRLPGGQPERVTLGKYPGLTIDQARRAALDVLHRLAAGTSQKKPKAKAVKEQTPPTLGEAVQEYVERKRRRDGLPLKESTRQDYLRLIAPGRQWKRGKSADGELYPLAGKRIDQIDGDMIRELHTALEARCKATMKKRGGDTTKVSRRAVYPLVVLRAILNWHKITIPDTPFGRREHDKDSIVLADTPSGANPIPPESIGGWWRAVSEHDTPVTRYMRFLALTGCRPSEPLSILVSDCNFQGRRIELRDTKNRQSYILFLSDQAAAIVKQQAAGKAPTDHLFGEVTSNAVRKATRELKIATGITWSPKSLRSTFGNVAESLVSAYVLKNLMRHSMSGDVTGAHYIVKGEKELRPGAQAVANWIEEAAKAGEPVRSDEVPA
ncbi:integrase family protein [Pseudogulbenkiania sp. MAI-1]|uniref:tyrosine-type recombinase/integrase n=1 Tax=Pseudogulbenkiania sp. MAI-1 TaxID=990370 RepID=UPI00045EA1D5|nr:integrase family protein [Pseudogulbenkiania sp. MAI-1]